MHYTVEALLAACAAWTAVLVLRCRLGFHGETMSEQVTDAVTGKRVPYVLQWRCRRCGALLPESSRSEFRPSTPLMIGLYKERKVAAAKAGRVLPMQRKRA